MPIIESFQKVDGQIQVKFEGSKLFLSFDSMKHLQTSIEDAVDRSEHIRLMLSIRDYLKIDPTISSKTALAGTQV